MLVHRMMVLNALPGTCLKVIRGCPGKRVIRALAYAMPAACLIASVAGCQSSRCCETSSAGDHAHGEHAHHDDDAADLSHDSDETALPNRSNEMLLVQGSSGQGHAADPPHPKTPVIDENTLPQISPQFANRLMNADSSYVYLDVRTPAEFDDGHVPGAYNVPLLFRDEAEETWQSNPEFLATVKAAFPPETKMIVGCRSGGRSSRATQLLLQNGYGDVSNLKGGFLGKKNEDGTVMHPGWKTLGLPVEMEAPDKCTYESLRKKSGSN